MRVLCFALLCTMTDMVFGAEPAANPSNPNPFVKALQPLPTGTRVDRSGDPLPEGMDQRLGGTRFKVPGWWREFEFAGNDEWIWMKADNKLSVIHRESGRVIKQQEMRLGIDPVWHLSVGANGRRVAIDNSGFQQDADGMSTIRVIIVSAITSGSIRKLTWKSPGGLSCLSLNEAGDKLLAVSHRDEMWLWNVDSGELLFEHSFRLGGIIKAALSADGQFALLGSRGAAYLWRISDGPNVIQLPGQNSEAICLAPNNRLLATIGRAGTSLYVGESGELLRVLNVKDNPHSPNADFGVSFSPDNKLIAIPKDTEGLVEIWDVESHDLVTRLPAAQPRGAKFSRNGKYVAVAGNSGETTIFDWPGGKQVSQPSVGHVDSVLAIGFVDDQTLISASENARVWDITSGEQQHRLAHLPETHIRGVAASPKGDRLVTIGYDSIGLWDRATGKRIATLEGHRRYGNIRLARFNSDGTQFVSWGDDAALRLWDATEAKLITSHTLDLPGYKDDPNQRSRITRAQALSGDTLFIGFGHDFFEFDISTGQQRRGEHFDRAVDALAVSEDGSWIVTGEREDPEDGIVQSTKIVLRDRATLKIVREWPVIDLQDLEPSTIDNSERNKVDVLKERQRNPTIVPSVGVAFSPDSKSIAWSRVGTHFAIDVARIDEAQPCASVPLDSQSWCFQFSPDGSKIASGGVDSTVSVWDWKNPIFTVSSPSDGKP